MFGLTGSSSSRGRSVKIRASIALISQLFVFNPSIYFQDTMKKLALFTLMILLTFSWAGAQEEEEIQTLFGGIDSHGGYGAFSLLV